MSKLARTLGWLSAGLGILTLLRPRRGLATIIFWIPKLLAGAWSPFVALAGITGALLGLARRDRTTACAGLLGAALAARYVARVTAPHSGFQETFGPGWESRIPPPRPGRSANMRAQVDCLHDLPYGMRPQTGDPLLANVWLPPPEIRSTGLAIVYIFGGAWHYLNKDIIAGPFLQHLASLGHLVICPDYTLSPRAQLSTMIADVKQAVVWLKTEGARYGVDPGRIVLMGCSSGGHMALLAAYTPNDPRFQLASIQVDTSVRAVVSSSGAPDLRTLDRRFQTGFGQYLTGKYLPERLFLRANSWLFRRLRLLPSYGAIITPRDMIPSLLGGTPEQVPDRYCLGSPIEHIGPHCPPTLLLQGGHDYSDIQSDVRQLHRSLRAAGVPSVYVEYPNTEHAFELLTLGAPSAPAARAALRDIERFLSLML